MADEFDRELAEAPEGSIITPIFLGCGAMGLGCVFSLGAIIIGGLIFFPGIVGLITAFSDNPMLEDAIAMAEANPAVIEAFGTPLDAELDDVDEASGADYEIGEHLELSASYILDGPNGTGYMVVTGMRELDIDDNWEITSLVVTPAGGAAIVVVSPIQEVLPRQPEPVPTDTLIELPIDEPLAVDEDIPAINGEEVPAEIEPEDLDPLEEAPTE